MLCAQEVSYRQQQAELQGLLEESNRAKNQLEAQQRYAEEVESFSYLILGRD